MPDTTITNPLEPVDQLIGLLQEQITAQQPTEAELLSAAQARYNPYFTKELSKVSEYYNMQRNQASQRYAGAMASIGQQQSKLQAEYKLYMEQIETGKLRAGSDEQRIRERALVDKKNSLDQLAFQEKQNLNNIQKNFISNEGLFSGSRIGARQTENEAYGYRTGAVEQGTQRVVEDAQTQYTRALEDYVMEGKQRKASMESSQAGLSGQAAGYQASISAAQQDASWAQREKEEDLKAKQQAAISEYVYGTPAYAYLGL